MCSDWTLLKSESTRSQTFFYKFLRVRLLVLIEHLRKIIEEQEFSFPLGFILGYHVTSIGPKERIKRV